MKTLKLNIDDTVKMIEIPDSWDSISVEKYSNLLAIPDELNPLSKRIKIVSVMLDLDEDLIRFMTEEDFLTIEKEIEFIKDEMPNSKVDFIEVEGEKYFLYTDFAKLTMGEQISIDILTKKSNGNLLSVYNELLCLFLRKKKDNGKFEAFKVEHMERAAIFNKVPIIQVNQLFLFFSSGSNS